MNIKTIDLSAPRPDPESSEEEIKAKVQEMFPHLTVLYVLYLDGTERLDCGICGKMFDDYGPAYEVTVREGDCEYFMHVCPSGVEACWFRGAVR